MSSEWLLLVSLAGSAASFPSRLDVHQFAFQERHRVPARDFSARLGHLDAAAHRSDFVEQKRVTGIVFRVATTDGEEAVYAML